jgi:hypothetical protein
MELFESIGWIALGFAPTLVGLEVAWKILRRPILAEAGAR